MELSFIPMKVTVHGWSDRRINLKISLYSLRKIFSFFLLSLLLSPSLFVYGVYALDRDAIYNQARQTSWQGNYSEAEALYRQLIEANEKDIEAWMGLAQVLSWQKKFEASRTTYKKIKELRPDLPDGEIGLLRLSAWDGNHAEAEKGLKALHEVYPERFDLLFLLGQVTAWQEKFDQSVIYFKKLLKIYPNNIEALKALATTYKWMKNPKDGIALYQEILEQDPKNVEAYMGIGILQSHQGDHENAIKYLEKAREIDPERQDVRAMLGTLYSWTARLDDAVTELQKSVALAQGDISSYIALGRVYSWQSKLEESLKLFKKALEIAPNNVDALVGLGNLYFFNDQWDLAEEQYLKALNVDPNNIDAKQAMERLKRAMAPMLITRFNFFEFRDQIPKTKNLNIIFRDLRHTLDYYQRLSATTKFQLRLQRVKQKQLDIVNNLIDFNVNANTGSFGLEQKLPEQFKIRFRYDLFRYTNEDNNSFNLLKAQTEHAGYFLLSKEYKNHLFNTSFSRDLFVDITSGNAKIESINTYLASYDVDFDPFFSILAVVALNDFSNGTGLRQNYIFRPRYRLPFYDRIQIEYQLNYLTNPDETEHSFIFNLQDEFKKIFNYEIDYIITHNSLDDAIEQLFTAFVTWNITDCISWTIDARLGFETGNDEDITKNIQTYITLRF